MPCPVDTAGFCSIQQLVDAVGLWVSTQKLIIRLLHLDLSEFYESNKSDLEPSRAQVAKLASKCFLYTHIP